MEMKQYQQEVINDLSEFISELEKTEQLNLAFYNFWDNKGISLRTFEDDYLKPYDNSIKGVPRVTFKVPTAGGKTFIACNSLKPIFDSFPLDKPKVVAWFVPSDTILKQTYRNLNDPSHPYRQKIDSHFGCAVKVYQKQDLLQGADFSPGVIKEQLSIFVLTVQSFSVTNKDGRKAYQENENLQEFPKTYQYASKLLPEVDETALMQVIAQLNPVVIIDESHNFEADLRIDMLNDLNPSFIVDLTATPRNKSNIISFVDAMKLKMNNMVKLPVIVYNHQDTNEVISSAIQMQKTLEVKANQEESEGGKYIRPIVLFQAQPKTDIDNITFERIKSQLLQLGIPETQIKIKTALIDEIKNTDLMSRECEVRFIITVNALKEGWDCPFAYILASLANKSSPVDVEQVLGRILRLPYVSQHKQKLLNLSYVFTSSNNFLNTLGKIIEALNKSGFSRKDYRIKEEQKIQDTEPVSFDDLLTLENADNESEVEIDANAIKELTESDKSLEQLNEIINLAQDTNDEFEKKVEEFKKEENIIPEELKDKMKTYPVKDSLNSEIAGIKIPSFFIRTSPSLIEKENFVPVTKNLLLEGFDLSKQDHNIDFTRTASEMYLIDLKEARKDEYVPQYQKMNDQVREDFAQYLSTLSPDSKIKELAGRLTRFIKNIDEIPEQQIKEYVKDAISDLDSDKISEISNNEHIYANIIKKKIVELSNKHIEKKFDLLLDSGTVTSREYFSFPKKIYPKNIAVGIIRNLYTAEGEMNDFERSIINEVANLDSVVFWHRNLERGKGFFINGYMNHYPDFIVKMKDGRIVLLETKGDDRDNTDSMRKLKLGNLWAAKAGDKFRYFMVFNTARLEGARTVAELLEILKGMK